MSRCKSRGANLATVRLPFYSRNRQPVRGITLTLGRRSSFASMAITNIVANTVIARTANTALESDANSRRSQVPRHLSGNHLESRLDATCGTASLSCAEDGRWVPKLGRWIHDGVHSNTRTQGHRHY
jgi:hypothetical protein